MIYDGCPFSKGSAPRSFGSTGLRRPDCLCCGGPLPSRALRWCSQICCEAWYKNHIWGYARRAAIERDKVCVRCKSDEPLEVNHIVPANRKGRGTPTSCANHLGNLETLCHRCHLIETNRQRSERSRAA